MQQEETVGPGPTATHSQTRGGGFGADDPYETDRRFSSAPSSAEETPAPAPRPGHAPGCEE